MKDKKRFAKNMTALADVLDVDLKPTKIATYWAILEKYTDDSVERALKACAETLRWFPKPVDLIEIIEGKAEDRAILAWDQLLSAVQHHGSYASVTFLDGKIAKAVELMGGWLEVCSMGENETHWKRKDFLQIYNAISGEHSPKTLMGRHEQDNRLRGFLDNLPEPILIGDATKEPKQIEGSPA